jgi:hypothetical protein
LVKFARYQAAPQSLPATEELDLLEATDDLLLDLLEATEDLLELFADDAGVDDAVVPSQLPNNFHSCHWPE